MPKHKQHFCTENEKDTNPQFEIFEDGECWILRDPDDGTPFPLVYTVNFCPYCRARTPAALAQKVEQVRRGMIR